MKLDFVIIGGQKCGSTYLHDVIRQHPEVSSPAHECPHFESPDFEDNGFENLRKILNDYDQDRIIGIKRPSYLSRPEVPSRILHVNKNVKIIVILRNPIERLKSAYFHNMKYGFSPILPLNKGIKKLLDGDLESRFPRSKELLEFSFYAKSIECYSKLFNQNLLILTHDQLKEDKVSVIKECYSFLNIDVSYIPHESLNSNPQVVNYSIARCWLLSKKNKHQYNYNEDKTRLYLKDQSKLEKFICRKIDRLDYRVFKKLWKSNVKPKYNSEIKKRLVEVYRSDIEALEKIIQRDLSNWIL